MKNIFKDKVVWITGASSGIGEELVYAFCNEGAKVILSSRNEQQLNNVKSKCSIGNENVIVFPIDLSIENQISPKAEQALAIFGRIDYLILNAGIVARDLAENTNLKIDREIMETNYFGTINLAKSILPSMLMNRSGHLVVISSLSGKYGVPMLTSYSASKHALHGFFDSLRTEVKKRGIDISIIIPGFINTQIINKGIDGSGKSNNKNLSVNENGMPARKCALKILKAIRNKKQETLIGGNEILSVYLNRFFPGFFKRVMRNNPMKRMRQILPGIIK